MSVTTFLIRAFGVLLVVALAGCLSEEKPRLDTVAADAAGRVHPAFVDCDTLAEIPETITAEAIAATPRNDRIAEELALFASGELVAPEAFYQRIVDDLAKLRPMFPEFTELRGSACGIPDRVTIRFDEDAFAQVQAGEYDAWDELNELLRGQVSNVFDSFRLVSLTFDGLYNGTRIEREYEVLPGVELTAMGVLGGMSRRACVAERSFYNFYIIARGSGDCPAGCIRWEYLGIGVTNSGEVVRTRIYDTAVHPTAPAWFENARDCRAIL